MSFDDVKEHAGERYTGMPVGGAHDWLYPDGRWHERKVAPDKWDFRFRARKRRTRHAPVGSGAEPGTAYHWFVMGHQRVRKVDADAYDTLLEGSKWRVAHKRPHWRKWSSQYHDQRTARERVIAILEDTLAGLRAEDARGAAAIEGLLPTLPGDRVASSTVQSRLTDALADGET